jgi:hypothetical protein
MIIPAHFVREIRDVPQDSILKAPVSSNDLRVHGFQYVHLSLTNVARK